MEKTDESIINTLRKMNKLGRKEIPIDTIVFSTGMSPQRVNTRLNSLSKYGFVRKKRKKPVDYWEMV